MQMLRPDLDLLDPELDRNWLHLCQHSTYGGIAREPGAPPGASLSAPSHTFLFLLKHTCVDIYHTYLSLAALSLGGQPGLEPLHPSWNVPQSVADRIQTSLPVP